MLGSKSNKAKFTRGCQIGALLLFVPILMALQCPPTVTISGSGCPDDRLGTVGIPINFTISVVVSDGSAVTFSTTVGDGDPAVVGGGDTDSNYIDAVVVDVCGNVYVTDVHSSSLYRITASGDVALLWEPPDGLLYAHALVWGTGEHGWRQDALYMAQPYN